MAQFGPSIQNAQISTGNFRTSIDSFQTGLTSPYNINGARNPLGAAYYDNSNSTLANPNGVPCKYRYVRYLSTSNPTLTGVTGPFVVFWTDTTFTTVTPVSSESLTAGLQMVAGIAMPNLTALPGMTAATLTTGIGGNFIWVAVGGYVPGAFASTATVTVGASITASATNFLPVVTAAGTAAPTRVIGYATTASATNLFNLYVTLES